MASIGRGEAGQKEDEVRRLVIQYCISEPNVYKGERVLSPENFADVPYGWSLVRDVEALRARRFCCLQWPPQRREVIALFIAFPSTRLRLFIDSFNCLDIE